MLTRAHVGSEPLEPVAVVDIGSNSVRLLVYEGNWRSAPPLYNEKVLCGLGRSLSSTGKMSADSIDRALKVLTRFQAIGQQLGVRKISAVATAAARDASNGAEFVQQASSIIGVDIDVLTGKREAELAAKGVISGFYEVDGIAGDLGGGSLEVTDIENHEFGSGATSPLGCLRLMDESSQKISKAAKIVDAEFDKLSWLKDGKGRPFFAIGGTWRAFAKLHMAQFNYPLRVMHNYRIPRSNAIEFARLIRNLSPASLEGIERVAKARRETVPFGALVLEKLLEHVQPSEVVISAYGLREGLQFEQLSKSEQKRDVLISLCEDLADLRARSPQHARELFSWTDPLFQNSSFEENEDDRRLRHATCLISDIGWRAHTEYRAEQSLSMISRGPMAGIDHKGRIRIALAVYFRHRGLVKTSQLPEIARLLDRRELKHARILGAAIRTAHMISTSMPNVVVNTPIFSKKGKVVLKLPPPYHILDGERLRRRLSSLANLFDSDYEIETFDAREDKTCVQA